MVEPFLRSFGFFSTRSANFVFLALFMGSSLSRIESVSNSSSCKYSSGSRSGRGAPAPNLGILIATERCRGGERGPASFSMVCLFRFLSATCDCFLSAASRFFRFCRSADSCLREISMDCTT